MRTQILEQASGLDLELCDVLIFPYGKGADLALSGIQATSSTGPIGDHDQPWHLGFLSSNGVVHSSPNGQRWGIVQRL